MALLDVRDLSVAYGSIRAVHEVSFSVDAGEIVALLGSNGAGKSSILRAISGMVRPRSGSVCLAGTELSRMPAHRVVAAGLGHVPEGRRLFGPLTVTENLRLGAYLGRRHPALVKERMGEVFQLFPQLAERNQQLAGTLSGGEQQMLAIGRALMSTPKVLALDEPSMGLAPLLRATIFEIIKDIARRGIAVLLVEQNAVEALGIAHRGYVLETGRFVLSGLARELVGNDSVRAAYLGGLEELG